MIAISCENLCLSFNGETLFENISFALNEGDKLGIVGVNGAGKSTLFRIIAGLEEPDQGEVYLSRDKTIGYLSQNPDFESDNTVLGEMMEAYKDLIAEEEALELMRLSAEQGNIEAAMQYPARYESFIARGGLEYKARARSVLEKLGFDETYHNMPIRSLSGGQKTRIALARLLLTEPDIILLDEPTNHLDLENIEWLEKYIAATKKTVLLISHDRLFLTRTTNKTLELFDKHAKLYDGNYDVFAAKKKKEREIQAHQYKNQQKEIARLEAHIEQQRRWGREKNIIKAESSQKRLDRIERIDAPKADPDAIRFQFKAAMASGNDVLSVKALSKSYPVKPLFDGVNFDLKKGDRAVIIGPNGCGKSTLLKIIYGIVPPMSGVVQYGYNVQVGYYDQEHHNINDNNTVIDELWNDYDKLSQTEVRSVLALFLFRGDDVFKEVSVLSGGEKARLSLAKLMLAKVNFLILDEPTNHLDIASREILEDALMAFQGTILAVSHDRYFIKKIATRILAFEEQSVLDYQGNYDSYRTFSETKNEDSNRPSGGDATRAEEPMNGKAQFMASKQAASERRKNERRYETLVAEIARVEKKLEENTIAYETDTTLDHVQLMALYTENQELEEKLLAMWEEVEELKTVLGLN